MLETASKSAYTTCPDPLFADAITAQFAAPRATGWNESWPYRRRGRRLTTVGRVHRPADARSRLTKLEVGWFDGPASAHLASSTRRTTLAFRDTTTLRSQSQRLPRECVRGAAPRARVGDRRKRPCPMRGHNSVRVNDTMAVRACCRRLRKSAGVIPKTSAASGPGRSRISPNTYASRCGRSRHWSMPSVQPTFTSSVNSDRSASGGRPTTVRRRDPQRTVQR